MTRTIRQQAGSYKGPRCFVFVGAGLPTILEVKQASIHAPGLLGKHDDPQRVSALRAEKLSRSTKATINNMAARMVAVLPMWNRPMWKDSICPRPPAPTTPSTAAARMLFSPVSYTHLTLPTIYSV